MRSARILAIAVLAIVIMPIGMGYVLSFDEVERSGWRTGESYNASGDLLNSTTPYYVTSTAPINNGALLDTFGNATLISPDYAVESANPSSLPVYETVTSYPVSGSPTTTTASQRSAVAFGYYEGRLFEYTTGGEVTRATSDFLMFTSSTGSFLVSGSESNEEVEVSGEIRLVRNDALGAAIFDEFGIIRAFGNFTNIATTSAETTVTVTIKSYSPAAITGNDYVLSPSGLAVASVVLSDGSNTYYDYLATARSLIVSGTTANVAGNVYTGITSISFASNGTLIRSEQSIVEGSFADPAYGWKFPVSSSSWYSANTAKSINIYAASGSFPMTFGVAGEDSIADYVIFTRSSSGIVSVQMNQGEPVPVGKYSYFQIQVMEDTIKVSGLARWPGMYMSPQPINSIELDRSTPSKISGWNASSNWAWRVDGVDTLSGTFPSTKDYTLNVADLLPDSGYSITFPSIGIYGDSITIGSTAYAVIDGAITVSGTTYRLLSSTISCVPNGSQWDILINGKVIDAAELPASVTFGGTWSLACMIYKMDYVTSSSMEWMPGEFALDEEGAALVGIITCTGVFIALAMVRPFSGSKMLMLAIICGGGIMLFLIIL